MDITGHLERSRPINGNDGTSGLMSPTTADSCDAADEQAQTVPCGDSHDVEKSWIVEFDGEDDPMNPRSMRFGRKWLATLVVASSSICV